MIRARARALFRELFRCYACRSRVKFHVAVKLARARARTRHSRHAVFFPPRDFTIGLPRKSTVYNAVSRALITSLRESHVTVALYSRGSTSRFATRLAPASISMDLCLIRAQLRQLGERSQNFIQKKREREREERPKKRQRNTF